MNLRYLFGSFIAVPLLPLMYYQGKRIRSQVPILPEAEEPSGIVHNGSEKLRLLAIGESTMAGVGVDYHKNGFTGTLAQELSLHLKRTIHWEVFAKSGYTVKNVNDKIVPSLPESSFDLVVIGLGGNDAFTLNSPKKWLKNVRKLIENLRIKYPKIPIAFTNMPPIKEFPAFTMLIKFILGNLVEVLGTELKKEVKNHDNVYYSEDIITIEKWKDKFNEEASKGDYFSDGVHPSALTYQTWAKDMAEYLISNKIVT